jgi:hypothetical protein
MQRKYPFVLGVIGMIFGGLSAFGAAIGLVIQLVFGEKNPMLGLVKAMPHAPGTPDPTRMLEQTQAVMRELAPWTTALLSVRFLLAVALLVIGYGLIKRAARARRAAIAWSGVALATVVAHTLFQVMVLLPKMKAITDEYMSAVGPAAPLARQIQSTSQSIGVWVGALFMAAFPVILLAFLGRASAKDDFQG